MVFCLLLLPKETVGRCEGRVDVGIIGSFDLGYYPMTIKKITVKKMTIKKDDDKER